MNQSNLNISAPVRAVPADGGRDAGRVLLYAIAMLENILRNETFNAPLPRLGDPRWRAVGAAAATRDLPAQADARRAEAVPPIPATAWMAFSRSGDRQAFEVPYKRRRDTLATLVVAAAYRAAPAAAAESAVTNAEASVDTAGSPGDADPSPVEAVGPELRDAISDYLWALCEESSWVYSAHLKNRLSTELPDPHSEVSIDLGSAMTGLLLAQTLWILGDLVHPEVALRVRREIEGRLIDPYLRYHDHHWMYLDSNWNSVCHTGVVGAAIYLDSPPELLALMIRKAEAGVRAYLAGFDAAGGSAEGVTYWSFGFGHFLLLNELIEGRTGGRRSLLDLDRELIPRIAAFPARVRLSPGRYVNFSDAVEEADPELFVRSLVRRRFGVHLDRHADLRRGQFDTVYHNVLAAAEAEGWESAAGGARESGRGVAGERQASPGSAAGGPGAAGPASGGPASAEALLFPDLHWFIARRRDEAGHELVLATKGGHNGEQHNHNDLGTFILHLDTYSFLADLGKDVYRRDHFTDRRYEFLSCSAAGHSVPIINDVLQAPGREHYASLVSATASEPGRPEEPVEGDDGVRRVEYDLTRAYPEEAGLAQLRRRFELSGSGGGTVRLTDDVELRQPGTYRARFWTFLEPEIAADGSVRLFRPAPRGSLLQRAERHAGGAVGIVLACETAELGAPQLEYVPRAVLGRGDEAIGAYRIDFLSPVVRKLHAAFRLSTSKSQRSS